MPNSPQETRALKARLSDLEAALNAHYCQMGKRMLELAEEEQRSVGNLVDEIILTRKQLYLENHECRCEACLNINPEGSNYCNACGARISQVQDDSEEVYP